MLRPVKPEGGIEPGPWIEHQNCTGIWTREAGFGLNKLPEDRIMLRVNKRRTSYPGLGNPSPSHKVFHTNYWKMNFILIGQVLLGHF